MAENENRIVLKTGYYLDNFTYLLDFVIKNYADLLSEAEVIFIENFKSLSQSADFISSEILYPTETEGKIPVLFPLLQG